MTFTPPQPPTPPAPAVRPTPPTPPRIDRTSFANSTDDVANDQPVDETDDEIQDETADEVAETPAQIETPTIETPPIDIPQVRRKVDDNESMARDAVAHGSGALTKRTVDNGDEKPNQSTMIIPPDTTIIPDTQSQSDYDRGQDVLRQFREEDARATQQSTESFQPQTVTEQPRTFKPTLNYHEGHGGVFWLGTIIFVVLASIVVVKKFLFTDKPALTKSELFADETDRLNDVREKISGAGNKQLQTPNSKLQTATPPPVKKPVTQPVTKPMAKPVTKITKPARPSEDDDKGKHFEIRV